MVKDPFIGAGHNPDGPDLPLGLGMELAQHPKAMDAFGRMNNDQKSRAIAYIQSAVTGDDAKHRIVETVRRLDDGTGLSQ